MKRASAIKLLLGTTILLSLILTSPFVRLPFHVVFYGEGEEADFKDRAITYVSKKLAVDLSGELVDHIYHLAGWRGDQDVSVIIQLSKTSANSLLSSDHIDWLTSPSNSSLNNRYRVLFLNSNANDIDKKIYQFLNEPGYLYMYRDDYAILHNESKNVFDNETNALDVTVCVFDPSTDTLYYREWDT